MGVKRQVINLQNGQSKIGIMLARVMKRNQERKEVGSYLRMLESHLPQQKRQQRIEEKELHLQEESQVLNTLAK